MTQRLRLLLTSSVLATLLLVPAPRTADAGVSFGPRKYRDSNHKFSLKMLKGFEQVPLKIDERNTVAKFRDPKAKGAARGTLNAEIRIVRIAKKNADGTGGGGPVVTGRPMPRNPYRREFKDAWDAILGSLRLGMPGQPVKVPRGEFDEIKSKDKVPGKFYEFEAPVFTGRGPTQLYVALGVYEKDNIEYGIACMCGLPLKKKHKSIFKRLIKSFLWFDKRADDVEERDELDGVNITALKRRQIEKSIVSGWDLVVSRKKNYIVLYNTANNRNHQLAKIIADRIEKIREQIYEVQFPPAEPIKTVCICRVCKDRNEFLAYGAPPGAAGYWSPGDEELVFYDASPSKKIDDNTLAVLYHEAFHQYIHYSVGRVAPHSWFNEGHGDYYAGADYSGGKFKIKPFQWRVGIIKNAIAKGPRGFDDPSDDADEGKDQGGPPRPQRPPLPKGAKRWHNDGGYTPLEAFTRFTQRQYYAYSGVSYAQGWSLIYFLREIVPKNKKYKEKWGHILTTYFDVLKAEVNRTGRLVPRGRFVEDEEEGDKGDDANDDDDGKRDDGAPTTPGDEPKGDGTSPDGGDEGPKPGAIPQTYFRGGPRSALAKAVQEAFKGVDWEEFEQAWIKGTKRGK